jgi:hypothetical protein
VVSGRDLIWASIALALVAVVACSSGSDADPSDPTPVLDAAGDATQESSERPTLTSTDDYTQINEENGLITILATTNIGVGQGRFAFVLTEPVGLVKFPAVDVKSFFYPTGYEANVKAR